MNPGAINIPGSGPLRATRLEQVAFKLFRSPLVNKFEDGNGAQALAPSTQAATVALDPPLALDTHIEQSSVVFVRVASAVRCAALPDELVYTSCDRFLYAAEPHAADERLEWVNG